MTAFQQDPILEELKAVHRETQGKKQQDRYDEESAHARRDLAVLDAEEAELAREAQHVTALRAVRDRAEQEYFAHAATHENKRSNVASRRMHLYTVLQRTMPDILRQEIASIEAQLVVERARTVDPNPEAQAAEGMVVRGLIDARDLVEQLAATDPAEIPAKLEAIRAAIPPAVRGPVPTKSYIERQAARAKEYMAARLRGEQI